MNKRFIIAEALISPLIFTNRSSLIPDSNYPFRYCVVDLENLIAIDIEQELKYDYLPTESKLFLLSTMNNKIDKIKSNQRFALLSVNLLNTDYEMHKKGINIIQRIKNGEQFKDGNVAFSNEKYLESIIKEQNKIQKEEIKTKKLTKRRKK